MINNLTIKIKKLTDGKDEGFRATIKELGNSIIWADSLAEIFSLMPDLIASCQKNNIGVFKKPPRQRTATKK